MTAEAISSASLHEDAYLTDFSSLLKETPPPLPEVLLNRANGRTLPADPSKIRVLIRLGPTYEDDDGETDGEGPRDLSGESRDEETDDLEMATRDAGDGKHRKRYCTQVDEDKRRLRLLGCASQEEEETTPSGGNLHKDDKNFVFDYISKASDPLHDMCAAGMVDVIQSVVDGRDACLFTYGHARLGKTFTMLGLDDYKENLGAIPNAIAWLYNIIELKKAAITSGKAQLNSTNGVCSPIKPNISIRYSIRVSAVEISHKGQHLKDLLIGDKCDKITGDNKDLAVVKDPTSGRSRLVNQKEVRASTAQEAALLLDTAISERSFPENENQSCDSHMLFTLHIYQYHLEPMLKLTTGQASPMAGGRSSLHLLDLASCDTPIAEGKDSSQNIVPKLGDVLLNILHGNTDNESENKLTSVLRATLANVTSHVAMLIHVSPAREDYTQTLNTLQFASRIHRMRRRRNKMACKDSDSESDCCRRVPRLGRGGVECSRRRKGLSSASSACESMSDGGEMSCDTVIYVGDRGQTLSDRDYTDNEGPPPMATLRSLTHRTKVTHPFVPVTHPLTVSPLAGELASSNNAGFCRRPASSSSSQPNTPTIRAPITSITTLSSGQYGPSRHAPCSPMSPGGPKSPRTQRREKTAAAVAKRYRLRRKELWMGAMKERKTGEQAGEQMWVDGPGNLNGVSMEQRSYDCFPPPAYQQSNEELCISRNINPCKPQQIWSRQINDCKEERWVDGPREFTRENQVSGYSTQVLPSSSFPGDSMEALMGSWPNDSKENHVNERQYHPLSTENVNEFTSSWLDKYHTTKYSMLKHEANAKAIHATASPMKSRTSKQANIVPCNKRTAEWVSTLSTNHRRVSDGGDRVFSPRTMRKIYTAEQTRIASEIPFCTAMASDPCKPGDHVTTEDVMTASITSTQQSPGDSKQRGVVDGEESGVQVVVAEVKVDYDLAARYDHARSRAVLRKPDGASNPSIPLTESPLPRKALLFNKLSQSKSLEFATPPSEQQQKKCLPERKSRSLVDKDTSQSSAEKNRYKTFNGVSNNPTNDSATITTTNPTTTTNPISLCDVTKRDAVVNLRADGSCVVTCTPQDSPYVSCCSSPSPASPLDKQTPPTQHQRNPAVSSSPVHSSKRSMLSRLGRFITSPARRSHSRSSTTTAAHPASNNSRTTVKLLKRPALVKSERGAYKAAVVRVAQPVEFATLRVNTGQPRRQDRSELRESSGYESFRNTDHTDASESADD